MRRYYRFKRYPFGQVTDNLGAHSIVDIQWNDSAVLQHRCSPDNPELLDLNLQPVNLLLPIIRSFSEQDEKEDEVYYYHGDHLGSASWITDKTGTPVQYIHYAPYGELIANQRATSYDERFKFTGKERDSESGYDYFGARFLWGPIGIWLSVDPLADKYPGLTPYLYCNGNPIMLVDPDGREIWNWMSLTTSPQKTSQERDNRLYYAAQNFRDDSRALYIFAHSVYNSSKKIFTGVLNHEKFVSLSNLVTEIKKSDYWGSADNDKFVVLFSCQTGVSSENKKSFGQALSKTLKESYEAGSVYVVAPEGDVKVSHLFDSIIDYPQWSEFDSVVDNSGKVTKWNIYRDGTYVGHIYGTNVPYAEMIKRLTGKD